MLANMIDIHILKLLHNPYFHLCSLVLSELHPACSSLIVTVIAAAATLLAPPLVEKEKLGAKERLLQEARKPS